MSGRAHPVMIAQNLWRVFYLIIIPVLRGFVTALQGGFASWVSGAWLDILILLAMLAFAILSWRQCRYTCTEAAIEVRSGLLFTRRTVIDWDHVATLSCTAPFYLRPLRAVQLRADTIGGSFRDTDIQLWLYDDEARRLMTLCRSLPEQEAPVPQRRFAPPLRSILAFSVMNSNSLGGIVFIATFISQSGRLFGNEFSDLLIGTFEEATRALALGIPPAAAAIAYALLIGWVIGFLLTVLRYQKLSLSAAGGKLAICSGYFTSREYIVDYSWLNFIDIRQTVFTKCLGFCALYISVPGYGKRKDDISCVLPTTRPGDITAERERFFPDLTPADRQLRPRRDGILAYIYPSLYYIGFLLAAMGITLWLFPSWDSFILFVALMLFVPGLLFLVVRIVDFGTCGISDADGNYTVRYSAGFQLHTVIIPHDKLVRVSIRQGVLQRLRGNCNVVIYTPAEGRSAHKCRNLVLAEVLDLFSMPV